MTLHEPQDPIIEQVAGIGGGHEIPREHHPAFGLISVNRSQGTPRVLFDSDIQHGHTVHITIYEADRTRDLNHDSIFAKSREGILAEVEMSEAQWASFVSSMGQGDGVPCTVRRKQGDWDIPGLPHAPRMAEQMAEVRNAADKALEKIREAFAAVEERPNKSNIRALKIAIEHMPANMAFAAQSLTDYTENVVQRATADIEAMVIAKAKYLGIDPAEVGVMPQLGPSTDTVK